MTTNDSHYTGGLVLGNTLIKESSATLYLGGNVAGYGRIVGNVHFSNTITRDAGHAGTLNLEGNCTFADGLKLDLEMGGYVTAPLIAIEGGHFVVDAPGGIVVNIFETPVFWSGSYVALDWSAATSATVSLDDFVLGDTVDGFSHSLMIENDQLILEISGPRQQIALTDIMLTNGMLRVTLKEGIPGHTYWLETTSPSLDRQWDLYNTFEEGDDEHHIDFPLGENEHRFFRALTYPW